MTASTDYPSSLVVQQASIASGQAATGALNLGGTSLVGIQLPAAFTGTTITFQAATSLAGAYQEMTGVSGATLSAAVAPGKYVALNPADFAGVQFIKLVSNAAEGSGRVLELLTRPV